MKMLGRVLNFLMLAFVSILCVSCQGKSNKNHLIDKEKNKKSTSTKIAEKPITKEINPNEVVFILPSQKQLDSLQATMDEEEYNGFVDDSNFYINQAKEYCENIHSVVVEVESGEQLIFVSENRIQFPFSTKGLIWDIIVFNGKTKPVPIDITNPQDEMIRVYNLKKK